ncbi:MAG: GGDEF domain-containing protein, partial [Chloroflexota bacterium]
MQQDPPDALDGGSVKAGAVERARATQAYRRDVRTTGIAVVCGIAAVFVVEALLPGTTGADRQGLLVSAALVAATGTIWFGPVPQRWFGERRLLAAAVVAQVVLLAMVMLTGGLRSLYLGYLVVPSVVLILAGSVRQVLLPGGLVFAAIALLAISSALAGAPPVEGAFSRLLLLAMVIATCAAVARATGRQRAVTTERAAGLADERVAVLSLAMTDALTNLPNRRALLVHLARLVPDAARTGLPFSVVALDVDNLKRVNDDFGHDAGDQLLRSFGKAIQQEIRGSDVGVRIGGDEFLILLPGTTEATARRVVERLAAAVAALPALSGPVRFSHGIASQRPGEAGE